jgi:hypothetical protein
MDDAPLYAVRCVVCQETVISPSQSRAVCDRCGSRYPGSLIKAHVDPFDYALKLATGEIIRFREAAIKGDYVRLSPADNFQMEQHPGAFAFDRGA